MKRHFFLAPVAAFLAAATTAMGADQSNQHMQHAVDSRQPVRFPDPLREHTLENMRDHLLTLQHIQDALAKGQFDAAAEISEKRLGLSSLKRHGAHDVAKYMPQGMQDIGTAMHKAASRFALEAENAGATGDLKAPLAALSAMTAQCVACHAAYRFK